MAGESASGAGGAFHRLPSHQMTFKLFAWIGAALGGALGWWAGAHVGVMTAFLLSVVGTGVGVYAGRRIAARVMP